MAWIESHQSLEKHGKLIELSGRLGITRHEAVGHLFSLWWWAIDSAPDGDISKYSDITIAEAAGWNDHRDWWNFWQHNSPSDSNKINSAEFVKILIETGWVDKIKRGDNIPENGEICLSGFTLLIHDWLDFCGDLVKKRLERKMCQRSKSNEIRCKSRSLGKKVAGRFSPPTVQYSTLQYNNIPPTPQGGNGNGHKVKESPKGEELKKIWNSKAPKELPRVTVITPRRNLHILKRLKEHNDLKWWEDLIVSMGQKPFLLGKNDRGWKADFDWLIKNSDNPVKVLEKEYGGKAVVSLKDRESELERQ